MTGTNHVLTGVAIGLAVHQPMLAIPLAITSHFVLDALPHYGSDVHDPKKFLRILAFDASVILVILLRLVITQPQYWVLAIVCGLLAASPDFMWLPNFLRDLSDHHTRKPYDNPVTKFHKRIQWGEKPYNWPYEVVYVVLVLSIVLRLA
jgi:hypothetical protein